MDRKRAPQSSQILWTPLARNLWQNLSFDPDSRLLIDKYSQLLEQE